MPPGLGTPASALSAVLYASNGDYANAALAGLGVLPVAGVAAKVGIGALALHGGLLAAHGAGHLGPVAGLAVGAIKDGEHWEQLSLDLGNLPAAAPRVTNRGSRGMLSTRLHLDQVRDEFLAANPDYTHIHGGTDARTGQRLREEYIPGVMKTKMGSARPDLTFEAPDRTRISTTAAVDGDRLNGETSRSGS